MATVSSNGGGVVTSQRITRPPPTPSPLRYSMFSQEKMRILVIGGASFIGFHLVDRLMEIGKNELRELEKGSY